MGRWLQSSGGATGSGDEADVAVGSAEHSKGRCGAGDPARAVLIFIFETKFCSIVRVYTHSVRECKRCFFKVLQCIILIVISACNIYSK